MSAGTHRQALKLPFYLLDLTLAQAQARQRLDASCKAFRIAGNRRAHSLAVKSRPPELRPELREGYLSPSLVEKDGRERRRPTSIAKDVRRPSNTRHANPNLSAPTAAASLLHDRIESLVRQTGRGGGELYALDAKETGIALANPELYSEEELHYTEPQLRDLYADLLAHPQSESEAQTRFSPTTSRILQSEKEELEAEERRERKELLENVKSRLFAEGNSTVCTGSETGTMLSPSSLASRLAARRAGASSTILGGEEDTLEELSGRLDQEKLHHGILLRVIDVVRSTESARRIVASSARRKAIAPVAVLSPREWNALVHTCIDEHEPEAAEDCLLLMKRCGAEPTEELMNDVLNVHASQGDVSSVITFFEKLTIGKPTELQRDLHIKAHLKAPSSPASHSYGIPSALETLHKYEALALIPPVKSYTRLICALFSVRSTQFQAQAWDLFAHMRYVAHAKPDPALYALMIRACAGTGYSQSGYTADPVRALDLWTEMTTEAGHAPTVGAYNAVILACARSAEYVGEAFRLAREMLDGHRDAFGYPLMHATQETFDALLVAAKTRGDLSRARWILAEMLKIYDQTAKEARESGKQVEGDVELTERTLMHVFHAYASYRPPLRREDTVIIDEADMRVSSPQGTAATETQSGGLPSPQREIENTLPLKAHFSVTPPQTRQEILAETDTLFERIVDETGLHPSSPRAAASSGGEFDASIPGPFSRVLLTARLLNSYLSVHYKHGTLENSRKLYEEVFRRTAVERIPRTYVEVLERCAGSEKEEREFAKIFAEDVWREWVEVEKGLDPRTVHARMIEQAYAYMIRMYSLIDDLDNALSLLRTFTARYTPHAISQPSQEKSEIRSTRTLLYANRPLIRLTTPTEVPDDTVPPLLTSRDLELLRHRLIKAGRERLKDLKWITYLGYAYTGALRKRRDKVIRA